jgi:uncharacterized protein (TIGR03086 family)
MTDENPTGVDLLGRALAQTREVVAAVSPTQAALPTPCQSWNVSQLVAHIVRDLIVMEEMARGGAWRPGEAEEISPRDWRHAVDDGAEALISTWRSREDFTESDQQRISQQTAEFVVHSWDVARATRQAVVIDADAAEAALAWAQRSLKPEHRGDEASGKAFGPEVPIAPTAPAGDRLAAFFGRDPSFAPATA